METQTTIAYSEAEYHDIKQISVDKNALELKSNLGLVFYNNQLFTGTSVTFYHGEVMAESIQYVNGKRQGKFQKWFPDGNLSFEASYANGLLDGTTKTWWKNGNLRSEAHYSKGISNGIQKQWYKSGSIFKEMTIVNGKEEGLQKAWRENGKIYNNYEAKNGRIFGLKRASLCYQLEDENVQY